MATLNINASSGAQNNNNDAGIQNIFYGGGQMGPEVNNIGGDLVKNIITSSLNPHKSLWDMIEGVGASHNAEQQYERGECLPGTRARVLASVRHWLSREEEKTSATPYSVMGRDDRVDTVYGGDGPWTSRPFGSPSATDRYASGLHHTQHRQSEVAQPGEGAAVAQPGPPICWLTGAAGAGKTAIAMTLAKSFDREGLLVSSFFFYRTDPRRNQPSALVPTIAHGLAMRHISCRALIDKKISEDPSILEAQIELQFRELVLLPSLQHYKASVLRRWLGPLQTLLPKRPLMHKKCSRLVIIDGLDECNNERTQLRVLSTIRAAFEAKPDFPLRFLICSRSESWIREAFVAEPLCRLSKVISLDEDPFTPNDTMKYYLHHFWEISQDPKYDQVSFPSPWPSKGDLEALNERTCGQFIYACTAVMFIKLASCHPVMQLRTVLQNTPVLWPGMSPYHQLDALYHCILSTNQDSMDILRILAAVLILPPYLEPSPICVELLFGLPSGQVALTLRGMHSVIDIRGGKDAIRLYHTSFRDYLIDKNRSHKYHIDIPSRTHDIARLWFQKVSTIRMRTYSFDQLYGDRTKRFFTEWIKFPVSIPRPTQQLLDNLRDVDLASVHFRSDSLGIEPTLPGIPYRLQYDHASMYNSDWCHTFSGLLSWVERYHQNELVEHRVLHLRQKFSIPPKCFHLEQPPDSSRQDTVCWTLFLSTGCLSRTRQTCRAHHARKSPPPIHLTDCHCNLSAGKESDDPNHLAYQDACLQLVKTLVSDLEVLVNLGSFKDDQLSDCCIRTKTEPYDIFRNVVDSWVLQHCRPDARVLSLCQTLFRLAQDCSFPKMRFETAEKRKTKLLEWIGTFPQSLTRETEALKAQVIALRWEDWSYVWSRK
ncbi:hypothetical protein PM082_021498 [Marasmius tenuissimus]|nr:hypothetical protein PM082_021498 [Marasmius tenuissimus]